MLVAGYQCQTVVDAVKKQVGVQHIIVADAVAYQHFLAENVADIIVRVCESKGYTHVLMPATNFGKDVLPRVAGLLDVAVIADVVAIIDAENFVRPMRAGTVFANIYSVDTIKLLTVRTAAFCGKYEQDFVPPSAFGTPQQVRGRLSPLVGRKIARDNHAEISIESVASVVINSRTWLITQTLHASARPELTSARIVVAGGRALQNAENFKLLERIAKRLNAALGASRAAIDAGCITNDCQVGQTGKTVAPDLYIAVGISGAIHHVAGMNSSKVIAAINCDEHAPIFQIADYGLVADLFTVLPLLEQELANLEGYDCHLK